MSVERRCAARQAVELRVQIRYRRRRFLSALARDISPEGMYLAVRNLTLPSGTLIELELECSGEARIVPAVVVHHSGAGVGVMFRDPQPELFRELLQPSVLAAAAVAHIPPAGHAPTP
jgi:hypothetical protein